MITLFSALALFAVPAAEAPSVSVAYADLDLSSTAGRATLDRRIARAVDAVCPDTNAWRPAAADALRNCREAAFRQAETVRAKAVARADQPRVTLGQR